MEVPGVPATDRKHEKAGKKSGDGKPSDTLLSIRCNEGGSQQRPDGRTNVSTDLEKRLSQPKTSSGSHKSQSRCVRMKNRRTEADQGRGYQYRREMVRLGDDEHTDQFQEHADGE